MAQEYGAASRMAGGKQLSERERRQLIGQIPKNGNAPAPAVNGMDASGSDLSRNVNNGLNALGGMGVVASVPMKSAGMALTSINGARGMSMLPTANAALQEGAQANALAGVTRGLSGASALMTGQDGAQIRNAPELVASTAPQSGVTGSWNATRPQSGVTGEWSAPARQANPNLYPYNQPAKDIYAGLGRPSGAPENMPAPAPRGMDAPNHLAAPASKYAQDLQNAKVQAAALAAAPKAPIDTTDSRAEYLIANDAANAAKPSYFAQTTPTSAQNQQRTDAAASAALQNIYSSTAAPATVPAPQPTKPATQTVDNPFAGDAPNNAAPAPAPATPAPAAIDPATPTGNVTRVGNSYSGGNVAGDITINGAAPRNGGMVSVQNQQAFDNLKPLYPAQAEAARGFQPAARNANPGLSIMPDTGGFGILDKGYQERRAAGMPLTSITANRAQRSEAAAQLARIDQRDLNTANNTNAVKRQGMADESARYGQELGNDTTRRGQDVTAAGQMANTNIAQYRAGLEGRELDMKRTTAGFGNRAAARIEALQAAYEKAPAADRAGIAEQLRVMTGKDKPAEWKAIALQGGTDSMGNKTEGVLAAVNERTGEAKRLDGQQQAGTLPPGMSKQVGTSNGKPVYEDGNGKRFVGA